ncbi:Eco57I restriction-modification methylase domain-containing protein [Sedimentibacter sp.]|uniref:HsdM family class I SAM-dependent methyltransferase n=1 Tax=Sedimentibacter sp. TaxID=1960295 RepID=UPI0028A03A42|nr:N-6 DNA methylase [Sedimentibacter sp.]
MQSEIYDIISVLAKDINAKIPEAFEKQYYRKMSYSSENKIIELDKELLHETISFEVAFVHVIMFIFNRCFNTENTNYSILLERLDVDGLFSWYSMAENFATDNFESINVQEFSDIYELVNQHDTFIDKNIKKKLGQFYTPTNIVQRMIFEIKTNLRSLTNTDLLIDPACGTGVFLIEIIEELKKIFQQSEVIEYVKNNMFAYDVNPFAVIATKINIAYILLKEFPEEKEKILDYIVNDNNAFCNIRWKNTVVEPDNNIYTIILGNPPYFKLNKALIKNISGYDEILYGQPNIYSFFMYWGMKHLKKDGAMSFIVPQSIRSGLYFKNLRSKMKDLRIRALIHIDSRQNVFDRAEQAVLIICLENKPVANSKTKIQFYDGNGTINSEFKVSRSKLMMDERNNHIFVISKKIEMYSILDKIFTNSLQLDSEETKLKFCNGLFVWNQHKKDIVDEEIAAIPIIYGGNIQPLEFDFSLCSTNEERKQYALITEKTKSYVLSGKRLLIQRTTNFERDIRLKSCIISDDFLETYERYFLENHVNFLCSSEGKDELLSLETMYYYLGMLNSKLVNYIFTSKSGNTQVSANELNSLPFPNDGFEMISRFVSNHVNELHEHQQELDMLVCSAYRLSEDETNFIINY